MIDATAWAINCIICLFFSSQETYEAMIEPYEPNPDIVELTIVKIVAWIFEARL